MNLSADWIIKQEVSVRLVLDNEAHIELKEAYINQRLVSIPSLTGRYAIESLELTPQFTFDVQLVRIG